MEHELKVSCGYFDDMLIGDKPFDVRRDDRGFKVGDTLILREYVMGPDEYTGRQITALITYILRDRDLPFGAAALKPDFCILGLRY